MERGIKRGPGRPRGSGRRPSSSSGQHHPYHSPTPASNNTIDFNSPTSIHARTPSLRGGRIRAPNTITTHASTSASATPSDPKMDLAYKSAPRSDRIHKQSVLNHSFTFSTPQNPRGGATMRKRARTFDPAVDGAADDEAEMNKGGHSLRKRARIDYGALMMNEDEDRILVEEEPPAGPRPEITVSARGGRRGRRPTIDPGYDADEVPMTTAPRKRGKPEKQRTVSPASSRRKSQHQRKPSAPIKPYAEQPSDTELKDTIEVGIPHPPVSSDEQSSHQSDSPKSDRSSGNGKVENPVTTSNEYQEVQSKPSDISHTQNQTLANSSGNMAACDEAIGTEFQRQPYHLENNAAPISTPEHEISVSVSARDFDTAVPQLDGQNEEGTTVNWVPQVSVDDLTDLTIERSEVPEESADSTLPSLDTLRVNSVRIFGPGPSRVEEDGDRPETGSQDTEIASIEDSEPMNGATTLPKTNTPPWDSHKQGRGLHTDVRAGNEDLEVSQKAPISAPRTRRRAGRSAEISSPVIEKVSRTRKNSKSFGTKALQEKSADQAEVVTTPVLPAVSQSPETRRMRAQKRQAVEAAKPVQLPSRTRERPGKAVSRITAPKPVPTRDFSFLTAYLDGQVVLYPEGAEDSFVPTPADTPALGASDPVSNLVDDLETLAGDGGKQSAGLESQDLGQQEADDQATLEEHESAAPTPAADDRLADTPAPDSLPATARNSPEPMVEQIRKSRPRKQFSYPRVRSPTEFVDVLKDHKSMSEVDLYNMLATVSGVLATWQNEYNSLKLITDDEDNAVRRRKYDATMASREAREIARTTMTEVNNIKPIAIKGIRAERTEKAKANHPHSNPDAYEKGQDQIAAQAWGFEWDPRPSMISRQDAIGQRDGLQNGRLRNRPKLSQRAAEAAAVVEEPAPPGIITGKRTRKQRILSDESKEPSRAATPVEQVKPRQVRRRRNLVAENAASENEEFAVADTPVSVEQPAKPVAEVPAVSKKPPGKKRGPKPKMRVQEAVAPIPTEAERETVQQALPAMEVEEQAESPVEQPKTRKRRRGPAAKNASKEVPTQLTSASAEETVPKPQSQQEKEMPASPPKKKQRMKKAAPTSSQVEIPASSFYSTVSTPAPAAASTDDSRPSTSSSSSTVQTADSNYSFRNRKRMNYSELADPIDPKPKRRRTKKDAESFPPGPVPPAPAPVSVLAPPSRFINMTPSNMAAGGHVPVLVPGPGQGVDSPFHTGYIPPKPTKIKSNHSSLDRSEMSLPPNPPIGSFPVPRHAPLQAPRAEMKSAATHIPGQPPQVIFSVTGMHMPRPQHHPAPAPASATGPGPASDFLSGLPPDFFGTRPVRPSSSGDRTISRGNSVGPSNSHSLVPSGRDTPAHSATSSMNGGPYAMDGSADDDKDYSTMTKSEKMSHSMKARWKSGSMQRAVDKRKETLARKKQTQAKEKDGQPGQSGQPVPEGQVIMDFSGSGRYPGGDHGGQGAYPAPLSATGSNSGMSNVSGSVRGDTPGQMQMQMPMAPGPVPLAVGPAAVGPEYHEHHQHGGQFENGA